MARKSDIRQIDDVAAAHGLTGPLRAEYGDAVEAAKAAGQYPVHRGKLSWSDLNEIAEDFKLGTWHRMKTVDDLKPLSVPEFEQCVRGLIGQSFGRAYAGYGDELRVTFGGSSERASRWELGTRTARWVLLGKVGVLCRESDGPRELAAFRALDGAAVVGVDASRSDRSLALLFDSGHHFVVMPNKPHRTKDDLDLWELFSPHGWWLAVRRDGSIEQIANDMPLADRQRRHAGA